MAAKVWKGDKGGGRQREWEEGKKGGKEEGKNGGRGVIKFS
jgi:hypothetical protein